jgi:hypothetical protein
LVFNKPIELRVMVVVKSLRISLERIEKIAFPNISKGYLVVFGYRDLINEFILRF